MSKIHKNENSLYPAGGNYRKLITFQKAEIKLINVAKASLQELLIDYQDYLRTRGHREWEKDSLEVNRMRKIARLHNDAVFYMQKIGERPPETIANIVICLIRQNDYLLFRQLKRLGDDFLKDGGIRERMTQMRINSRKS